ncbi:uncharacterized protein ACLA_091160 [Aspergillus clavatus NRRL 1]|uniref:Polarized growth protein (Boi2) n=1 Tax=Aspergillus clavatus (strain ATCC 1007 / CBS 513.65 / DSM 816 / NCTC 3887 / NRRL 1 / QM 1276 / 107) TaxID=344612 RepID=A1CEW9_ASPCL|nr:uncharacterized protein ACLA_091160 [Aspergillus clavatus NRRL 1]EAW11418.1 conserved hypothetical protein [Aspergillus clavatus NRRL 1]
MSLVRLLLSRVLNALIPLAIASSLYLYLYPIFQGCAFPLPTSQNEHPSSSPFGTNNPLLYTLSQHLRSQLAADSAAAFRLLVLADPQLEGDSSLPSPEEELSARILYYWTLIRRSALESPSPFHPDVFSNLTAAVHTLFVEDVPRALLAAQKRVDLLGNDFYLAHIYRTLHWWTRPTHVTVLGDLIGSQWVTDEEFDQRGGRYWNRVFREGERVSDEITITGSAGYGAGAGAGAGDAPQLEELNATHSVWERRIINIAGNHDIGYAGDASEARIERFERVFGRANWDIRFQYTPPNATADSVKPTLHLINLNTLTLDGPALSAEVQSNSYAFINDLITHRTYPVEDRTTFTLLLTHLPLHKKEGICTDGPYFTYFEFDDTDGPNDVPRFKEGGLREQNHLSDQLSAGGVLQGIFGMSGNTDAAGGGWGRNGLILNGHDHTGCDVVHFVNRSIVTTAFEKNTGEMSIETEESPAPSWTWAAKRYNSRRPEERLDAPSIREVTLRAMMGEYGGNAGLLSVWFDATPGVNEWQYEITMCMAGVQHIWWAVHVLDIVTVLLLLLYTLLPRPSKKPEKQPKRTVPEKGTKDDKK